MVRAWALRSRPASTLLAVITLAWLLNVPKPPFLHLDIEANDKMALLCLLLGLTSVRDQSAEPGVW